MVEVQRASGEIMMLKIVSEYIGFRPADGIHERAIFAHIGRRKKSGTEKREGRGGSGGGN